VKCDGSSESLLNQSGHTGSQKPTLWVKILTVRSRDIHEFMISDDTGTTANWIHPDIVRKCGLTRKKCEARVFDDFQGGTFICHEQVEVRWIGKGDIFFDDVFMVAPQTSGISLLLGEDFVDKRGRAKLHCVEKFAEPAHVVVMKKAKVISP
jgi:hypothetical protein